MRTSDLARRTTTMLGLTLVVGVLTVGHALSAAPAEPTPIPFGISETDFPIPADFDGDGKTDIALYRSGNTGTFSWKQSSDGAVKTVQHGTDRSDATVTGDYDGDGKADPAVFDDPLAAAGPCFFRYRSSAQNGDVVSVQWGTGRDGAFDADQVVPYPGDFDGDGKFDYCVYKKSGAGVWEFLLKRSSDGGTETIELGDFTLNFIVPGDYDGDGRTDFMVAKVGAAGGAPVEWTLLTRATGVAAAPVVFGISSDLPVPGDYDGDGSTDIAMYRRGATEADASRFLVRRSSDLATADIPFGLRGDFAAATWTVK